jgi:hypothetical protein
MTASAPDIGFVVVIISFILCDVHGDRPSYSFRTSVELWDSTVGEGVCLHSK